MAVRGKCLAPEPSSILYYLKLNSGIGQLQACSQPCRMGVVRYMPVSFLYSKWSTFPAAWMSGQSYASISHTPPKCAKYAGSLPLKAFSFSCLFFRRNVGMKHWALIGILIELLFSRLQIQGNRKLIPCFRKCLAIPTYPSFYLLVNGFCVTTFCSFLKNFL